MRPICIATSAASSIAILMPSLETLLIFFGIVNTLLLQRALAASCWVHPAKLQALREAETAEREKAPLGLRESRLDGSFILGPLPNQRRPNLV